MIKDGLTDVAGTTELANLGCKGRHPQNIERDMHRKMKRKLGIELEPLELFMAGKKQDKMKVSMLLPHELWAALWTHESKAREVFLGQEGSCRMCWQSVADNKEEWYMEHPLRDHIQRDPDHHVPLRLWGDDAPITKNSGRTIRTMSMSSCVVFLQSFKSKLAIYAMELVCC